MTRFKHHDATTQFVEVVRNPQRTQQTLERQGTLVGRADHQKAGMRSRRISPQIGKVLVGDDPTAFRGSNSRHRAVVLPTEAQAAARIREHLKSPIIFLTSHADDETTARAMNVLPDSAIRFVMKPIQEMIFKTTLETILQRPET